MGTAVQEESLARLREHDKNLRVTWNKQATLVTHVAGALADEPQNAEDPISSARAFMNGHRVLFGIEDLEDELGEGSVTTDAFGWHHVSFSQRVNEVPVWGSVVTVHLTPGSSVRSVSSGFRPGAEVDTQPTVTAEEAVRAATSVSGDEAHPARNREPRLAVYVHDGQPHLAWVFTLRGWAASLDENARVPASWLCFVDAHHGSVIARFNQIDSHLVTTGSGTSVFGAAKTFPVTHTHAPDVYRLEDTGRHIQIFDAAGDVPSWTGGVSGALSEDPDNNWSDNTGATSTDHAQRIVCQGAEVDAIDHFIKVQDYYSARFGRNGLDDAGMATVAHTHVRTTDQLGNTIAYNNAYWDPDNEFLVFGDGEYDGLHGDYGDLTYFSAALDIVAHEYAHGVTNYEIEDAFGQPHGFIYSAESGATSEAFSDIFAAFVDGDWWQGDRIVVLSSGQTLWSPGKMWRDLSNPTRGLAYDPADSMANFLAKGVPQPDHYDIRYQGPNDGAHDNGGVHINNSILTYACYLAAHGGVSHRAGRTPEDVRVYRQDRLGVGNEHAEQVLYHALRAYLNGATGVGDNQDATFSEVRDAVLDACDQMAVDHQHGVDECDWKTLRTAFYAVGLHPAGEAYGPDPMITPWGIWTGSGAPYQSRDVWVEDPSGTHVNAEKGVINHLVAQVHNIGDSPAAGVTVRFSFSPFGFGYHHEDFQSIGDQTVNLATGETASVAIDWDLTDLTDDFGGVWPRPVGDFDHFCVRVRIISDAENDVNTCNNMAQHNFVDVGVHAGAFPETLVIIANPDRELPARAALRLSSTLPKSWKILLDGVAPPKRLSLEGNEKRVVKLGVQVPDAPVLEAPLDGALVATLDGRTPERLDGWLSDVKLRRGDRFKGLLRGTLTRKGDMIVATVDGRIVDAETGEIEGKLQGTVFTSRSRKTSSVRGVIKGKLTPERRVSLGARINGVEVGGVDLNLLLG